MNYRINISLLIAIFVLIKGLPGQNKPIDFKSLDKWPSVEYQAGVTDDGKVAYFVYSTSSSAQKNLKIRRLDSNWTMEIADIKPYSISVFTDSKYLLVLNNSDSLCIVELNSGRLAYMQSITSFKTSNTWVAATKKDNNQLILRDVVRDKTFMFDSVSLYDFAKDGGQLIMVQAISDRKSQIMSFSLPLTRMTIIEREESIAAFCLSRSGNQLVYLSEGVSNDVSFWKLKYMDSTLARPTILLDDRQIKFASKLILSPNSLIGITTDGKSLYLQLRDQVSDSGKNVVGKPDVWNYLDGKLQSQQLLESQTRFYMTVLNFQSGKLNKIEDENEKIIDRTCLETLIPTHYFLVRKSSAEMAENVWNIQARDTLMLKAYFFDSVSVEHTFENSYTYNLSPSNKYLIFYDSVEKGYFSLEISTRRLKNIAKGLNVQWTLDEDLPEAVGVNFEIAGWLEDETGILVYDKNDIWSLDPDAIRRPINITKGFGKKNDIVFRLASRSEGTSTISLHERLLIAAFNRKSKQNGFYTTNAGGSDKLRKLTMESCLFYFPTVGFMNFPPKKAKHAKVYLFRKESAAESPNYFVTTDFINLEPLSDIFPEKRYNWITSELVSWPGGDRNFEGVLFKPQDFDSTKKYPVIVHVYERFSHELNMYHIPSQTSGHINIPYYVSNGYLIFTPDILYSDGVPGRSAFNAVVSGLEYLAKYSWIDTSKIGIQGHSFGGFETFYMIAHSSKFKAACAGAGVSNFISAYASVWGFNGSSRQGFYETGQPRMGKGLWEVADRYIENSAVIYASKITSPVLMMHNKKDGAVDFSQSLEMFLTLRRLGKKAWMLQYDDGIHGLFGESADDYTIRMKQFFDHYLKDSACPKWMLNGIPARLKGVDYGLELVREKDSNGKWLTPPEGGLLTEEEKKKIEALRKRKPVNISLN